MIIVIALQLSYTENGDSLRFLQSLCRNRGCHTIILALNGLNSAMIEPIRSAFDGILPQQNIRLWYPPDANSLYDAPLHDAPEPDWKTPIGGMILKSFLESLNPDIVLLDLRNSLNFADSGLSKPLAFLLPGLPSVKLIKSLDQRDPAGIQASRHTGFFLVPDVQSRSTWISRLNVEECNIATLAEKNDETIDQQAINALEALEVWHKKSKGLSSAKQSLNKRPKLAYLSPLPPERTGISDYSAELLPELSRFYEIDVVVDQKKISDHWITENCAVRTVTWFRKHADRYDHVLYHFGNSPFHLHMFDLLAEVPGVVVLHDFFLSDILEFRDHSGKAPGSFPAALYHAHGYPALQRLFAAQTNCSDVVADYPCNFNIVQQATGVIVHSTYARSLAEACYGNRQKDRLVHLPLLRTAAGNIDRAEARRALGFDENDLIVCSFGLPDSHKLSHRLLEAWQASSLASEKQCTLVFVGELLQNDYCRKLQKDIDQLDAHIRLTGWVPIEEYRRYLAAADIGVQLRSISRGESSASALDCMNYGLATVVNANGSMAELPEECVMMLPNEVTVEKLKEALETLRNDLPLRHSLGNNARNYILNERSPTRIAERYAETIERFSHSPEAIHHNLLQQIAHNKTIPDTQTALFAVAEAVSATFPPLSSQQQFLIDVSALVTEDLKTGIQRVVRSVLMELLENPPNGFRVEPVFMAQGEHGAYYRYARQFTMKLLGSDERSRSQLCDEPIDVQSGDIFLGLDLCHNVRHGLKFFESFRRRGGQLYFVVYDLLPLQFPHFFPPEIDKHHSEWMSVVAQGNGVLCISRSVADTLKEWFDLVQPHRHRPFNIGWFHLGADIENSVPTKGFPEKFDETLQKLSRAPTFLMVGTVEPRKGHLQVLKAFEMLWMTGMKVNLVIVGKKGWMVEEVSNRLTNHKKLNKRLFWYQGLSDEALQKLYKTANGVIMASEGEGFGLPLIEAAQHACPIFTRDLPVFREVAGNHATYFSGESPLKLAKALSSWIDNLKKGTAPQSSGMPWLTWKKSAAQIVSLLTDTQNAQWVYQWKNNNTAIQRNLVRKSPKCIAVDLTLVLPGGENGGAKVFLLELLGMLARMKPKTQFILLTRESSHKELAFLERPNMRRMMVKPEHTENATSEPSPLPAPSWRVRTLSRWKRSVKKRIHPKKQYTLDPTKTLREIGVDLLYCPFTSLDHAEPGIPSVCTIHDLQYKTYPEFFSPEEVVHRNRLFIDACQRCTALAVISDYSRNSALTHGNLDPSKIRTIHHHMAHRILSVNGEDSALFTRLNLEKQHYLLYPANFWQHKNHEMLLTAFEKATRDGLDKKIKLVCTGAPGERQKFLIGKANSMGLSDRVIFPGYLPDNELAVLLSNCIGMIFPSLYEGFGLPVIEAMAAGVPVACSNTRALPEVTSGAALLFDPDNPEEIAMAIVSLTSEEPLRQKLIKSGLIRAREFSNQEQMAQEYWELFEEAVSH